MFFPVANTRMLMIAKYQSKLCCVLFMISLWCCYSNGAQHINVALGKPTKQKDDYRDGSGESSNAVDGNRNSNYIGGKSCSCTNAEANTYWVVDLLREYPIHRIDITNRDLAEYRLKDFYIYVSNLNPFPIPSQEGSFTGQLCLWYSQNLPVRGPHSLLCDKVVTGRYVYVWKKANEHLTICEFEVIADKELESIQDEFSVFPGRKSSRAAFYSTFIRAPTTITPMRCVMICFSSSGGFATIVQIEKATGKCECIEESGLTVPAIDIVDSGWTLMKSLRNPENP